MIQGFKHLFNLFKLLTSDNILLILILRKKKKKFKITIDMFIQIQYLDIFNVPCRVFPQKRNI